MCNLKVGPICFLCAAIFPIINEFDLRSVNGGVDCATCTIVLGLVEKLSIVYNENIINSLEQLCNALPTDFPAYGKVTIEYLGLTRSLYPHLFDLDHYNHRDYPNITVNGVDSGICSQNRQINTT
ncbi:unnamed protein product [Adineta ricciae]|uniref:Saposin B-type domain-containing protein n=1 Tax=Adineta ricciae TaxID=249248 RepID=A0A814C5E6_ADIRI|nr:unnamed protein product [Adineta ricciae]